MLKLDLKANESIRIGDAVVHIVKKSGGKVSLAIDADRSIPIQRLTPAKEISVSELKG